jgi:hypothetical protein
MDENGDLLADSHRISNRRKKDLHAVNGVRQTEKTNM